MQITITIDIPELDNLQSAKEQFESLYAQYQATLDIPGVTPSAMIETFIKDAANIEAPDERCEAFIKNLFCEEYKHHMGMYIVGQRVTIQNKARDLIKQLDKFYGGSGTPLQLARKKVSEILGDSVTHRIMKQARQAASQSQQELEGQSV